MQYDFENKPRRSFLGLGAWIIIIFLALGAIGGTGSFFLGLASQPGRIVTQTFDANNILYNYEWFRTQYQDVAAIDKKIVNAQNQLDNWVASAPQRDTWKIQDRQMYNQLNSIVLGLSNQRAQMVADYNARATMANRSIFMNGLPAQIN